MEEQAAQIAEWNARLEARVTEQVARIGQMSKLTRFLSPKISDLIMSGDADDSLKARRTEITVVFVDLRGFTGFTETAEPEEVMSVLREYHAELGREIMAHDGTIEHFAGDGAMILFNAPVQVDNHELQAIRMALRMRESMAVLASGWKKRGYGLGFGVGIAGGYATIGAIGYEGRLEYSATGTKETMIALAPLETLVETRRGRVLPLPPKLAGLYGRLRMPLSRTRPHVFSNFVTTLDGVVSLNVKGHASGGDISGSSAQDRMVMGLLRAIADVVIIGSGTLAADRRHVWTAAAIFPRLADEYRRLSEALGQKGPPLNVVVSGSGGIDLRLPIFTSGDVPSLIITTAEGAKRLHAQRASGAVEIRAVRGRARAIAPSAILAEVRGARPAKRILVEGGPRLLGDFYAAQLVDEQFLTLAPQIAGRDAGERRLSLVMGKAFAPGNPLWGTMIDVRRGSRHLFLRYSFPGA